MAYNVIKGNVEFSVDGAGSIEHMVDDHSDQTIEGTKTFSQMVTASSGLSASIFYGDGSGLSGVRATPEGDSGAIQFNSAGVFGGTEDFKFDGTNVILQGAVSASYLSGSGENIFNITPGNINGTLNAGQVNLGHGLEDSSNAVRVKLDSNSGIARSTNGIKINVGALTDPTTMSNEDLLIVEQGGSSRKLPLSSLAYYLDNTGLTFDRASGNNGSIQFKENDDLASSANLTFDSSTNLFSTIDGRFESITIDTTPGSGDAPLIVLDKGNASASYIEFKEEGTKFAEIKTTFNEQFSIRTTAISQGIYIQQGAGTLLQFLNGTTTFKTNDIVVEENVSIKQNLNTTGTIRGKVLEYFTHRSTLNNADLRYLRFNKDGANIESSSERGKIIAPYPGKLIKVLVRTANQAEVTQVSFHKGGAGDQNVNSTPIETVTENIETAHTTVIFEFGSSSTFDAGQILGLSINPTATPGDTIVTSVWEFDQNS